VPPYVERANPGGRDLLALLAKLGANAGARGALAVTSQVRSERSSALDLLLDMLAAVEPAEARRRQDVVRALALCDSRNEAISVSAAAWLQGDAAKRAGERSWGFSRRLQLRRRCERARMDHVAQRADTHRN